MGILIFVVIALYVTYGYSLQLICRRIGIKLSWLSWTPFSPILIYKAGDEAWWWFIVLLIPFIQIVAIIKFFIAWSKIFKKINWKLAIIPLISFFLMIGSPILLVFSFLTSSEPYKMALTEIQRDPDIIRELGQPINARIAQWEIIQSIDNSTACLFVQLSGSKGNGLAAIEALEMDGFWKLYRLIVKVEKTNTLWFIKVPLKREDIDPCPNNGIPKVSSLDFLQNGLSFEEQGNYEEAFKYYSIGIKLDPNNTEFYTNRGGLLVDLGKYKDALIDLNRSIEIDPNNSRAYNNRATVRVILGDKKSGILDLSTAIKIDPNYARAYFNRGIFLTDMGNTQEALSDFSQAIKLNIDYSEAYLERGNLYVKLGNNNAAIQDFKKLYNLGASQVCTK
jgi:tetratricopeptide (TPR) repeat protein